jgi:hypothetical protein
VGVQKAEPQKRQSFSKLGGNLIIIDVPPRNLKSLLTSVALPAWMAGTSQHKAGHDESGFMKVGIILAYLSRKLSCLYLRIGDSR